MLQSYFIAGGIALVFATTASRFQDLIPRYPTPVLLHLLSNTAPQTVAIIAVKIATTMAVTLLPGGSTAVASIIRYCPDVSDFYYVFLYLRCPPPYKIPKTHHESTTFNFSVKLNLSKPKINSRSLYVP